MTSRERVWKAINFEEPDRVPIDIGGTKVTSVSVDEYVALTKHVGLELGPPKVYYPGGMTVRLEEPMRERFHSDVIQLENPAECWGIDNTDWKPWHTGLGNEVLMPGGFNPVVESNGYLYIKDANGVNLAFMPPRGLYFERACLTEMSDEIVHMDPEKWKKSLPLYTDEHLEEMAKTARYLHENTEFSVHGGFLGGSLGTNAIFAGHTISDWLCILATDREYAGTILRATAEGIVENLKLYLEAVGDYIDTILISGTDFGTQRCELFRPDIFQELYLPNYRLINDYIHAHSHAKTMNHSCGSIINLIDYFIEAGVDILNPIQTSATGMNPEQLKQRFGGRIVFWGGGMDTQATLQNGSVAEVRDEVKERINIFAKGAGFVFTPEHCIQYGVPPENVLAMVDAAQEFGRYPICA